jgi:hypothetical protein
VLRKCTKTEDSQHELILGSPKYLGKLLGMDEHCVLNLRTADIELIVLNLYGWRVMLCMLLLTLQLFHGRRNC